MATILLAWELGGGLGHFMNLRPLADGLARRGHRVVAALRDLTSARQFLPNPNVALLQAPFKHQRMTEIEPTCTFAQILHNCGFGDPDGLATLAEAWRHLYDFVKPDLIAFDHSPTALLTARGFNVAGGAGCPLGPSGSRVPSANSPSPSARPELVEGTGEGRGEGDVRRSSPRLALIGTGFFSPPDVSPLPNLRTWITPDESLLHKHEAQVLDSVNTVLARWNAQPLDRVAQLYQPIEQDFLLTFRELDCYAEHRKAMPSPSPSACPEPVEGTGEGRGEGAIEYWGTWSSGLGEPPNWPHGRGQRIFAYLKPFPAIGQLLATLNGLPNPALIYAPGIDPRLKADCRNPTVHFADAPVEMSRVANECDLAILNGTHATTAAMLLAGKPALHIPIFLEQAINARAAERLGAAMCVSPSEPKQINNALVTLLSSDRFTRAAQSFAAGYRDFNPDVQIGQAIDRAEELATANR